MIFKVLMAPWLSPRSMAMALRMTVENATAVSN
jgi:hypothetical protein